MVVGMGDVTMQEWRL